MEYWQELIKLLGGSAILVGALVWLTKSLVTAIISKDIESFKMQLKLSQDLSSDHLVRKRDVYVRLINSMRALLEESCYENQEEFIKSYNEVCLWAPPEVANSISYLLALAKEQGAKQSDLHERYTSCLKAMRKDCGFSEENFEYHIINFNTKKP